MTPNLQWLRPLDCNCRQVAARNVSPDESRFWPRPIFADCEGGRGSLADRNVPYAEIKNSQDMLDFLSHLKDQERLVAACSVTFLNLDRSWPRLT